jgi:hypothetical protein
MEDLKGLTSFVSELKARKTSLVDELSNIEATLSHLARLDGRSKHTGPASARGADTKTKRIVSAASRRKMALAQKARWANIRKKSRPMAVARTTSPTPAKRKISAAGRKRIAAATRARWAAFRAAKKKAA